MNIQALISPGPVVATFSDYSFKLLLWYSYYPGSIPFGGEILDQYMEYVLTQHREEFR